MLVVQECLSPALIEDIRAVTPGVVARWHLLVLDLRVSADADQRF